MTSASPLNKTVILIISGGIAAYKALDLIRRLRELGVRVLPVLTKAAEEFVTPLSVSALAGTLARHDLFDLTDEAQMGHIALAREADLIVVCPASADILARIAQGRADDLATTVLLATTAPVLVCPAMNHRMWAHPATQDNMATLTKRGIYVAQPDTGDMACGEYGVGRLPDVGALTMLIELLIAGLPGNQTLTRQRVLVTSGGTNEIIDPVRFIGNYSSGLQGNAIAAGLALCGAEVILIHGHISTPLPCGVTAIFTPTAAAMMDAAKQALPVNMAICAAAVADWKPTTITSEKIKKNSANNITLSFTQTDDILAFLSHITPRPHTVIGFAAETHANPEKIEEKRQRKGCDGLLYNFISPENPAFGVAQNTLTFHTANGAEAWPSGRKTALAARLIEQLCKKASKDTAHANHHSTP